jgi:hypothetical protein
MDVKIENQFLPAGKYGIFVAYGPDECILISSVNAASWGAAITMKMRTSWNQAPGIFDQHTYGRQLVAREGNT